MMEEVTEFRYYGMVLCKHGIMEGEIRERIVKGRQVIGALVRVMKRRSVNMEVKKGIRNSYPSDPVICISHGRGMQHSNHVYELWKLVTYVVIMGVFKVIMDVLTVYGRCFV